MEPLFAPELSFAGSDLSRQKTNLGYSIVERDCLACPNLDARPSEAHPEKFNSVDAANTVGQMQRTAQAILQDAEETLAAAKLGLEMLCRPESRRAGLRNVIVFGRAFTNVLQNLRTPCGGAFDAWYKKYQKEMQTDELMRYFYTLRSQILKEGSLRTSSSVLLSGNPHALMRRFPRPKFATNFFIGDQNGGSGWELTLPDGKKEKLYLELPPSAPEATVEIKWSLPDAPKNLVGRDISEMAERFLAYFEGMLSDAKKAFESHKA